MKVSMQEKKYKKMCKRIYRRKNKVKGVKINGNKSKQKN